jgi:hypothetical protein
MTENEMLRATSGSRRPAAFLHFADEDGSEPGHNEHEDDDEHDIVAPSKSLSSRRKGRAVFTQTAVWDFLVDHPLIQKGHVDIQDAWDRVKRTVKNGVDGPVYVEGDVKKAIEKSRKGGGDAWV